MDLLIASPGARYTLLLSSCLPLRFSRPRFNCVCKSQSKINGAPYQGVFRGVVVDNEDVFCVLVIWKDC